MRIATEDLNDARPDLQTFKAITIGPFHMAAISEGDRDVDISADDVQNSISIPDDDLHSSSSSLGIPSRFVSIACGDGEILQPIFDNSGGSGRGENDKLTGNEEIAMQCASSHSVKSSRAKALAATFKMVLPLAGGGGDEGARNCLFAATGTSGEGRGRGGEVHEQQHSHHDQMFSLESMIWPGYYLTLSLSERNEEKEENESEVDDSAAATTVLPNVVLSRNCPLTFAMSLQPSSSSSSSEVDDAERNNLNNAAVEEESLQIIPVRDCTSTSSTTNNNSNRENVKLSFLFDFKLAVTAPAAEHYPKGARLLTGKNKSYILAPIGQIIDEHYTAYLEFAAVEPSSSQRESVAVA